MPFKSKAQTRAAFGGYLGPQMKKKATKWAKETPNMKKLPQHVKKETKLNEAVLENTFNFWVVEKSKSPADNPLDLVFETDPIGFANQVRGGLVPEDIYGFYLDEVESHYAAHDQVKAVFEAAKSLEEKKVAVAEKIEKTIKKLQQEVSRCTKEGDEQRAKNILEKITQLKQKGQMVEASKKPIEEISYEKSGLKNPKKADLDKNKGINSYEQKKGKAIEKSMKK